MSGSSYPTVGVISPLLYKLMEITLAISDEDSQMSRRAKKVIYDDLKDRYTNEGSQLIFKKCAYLDPRFKDLDPFLCQRMSALM